MDPKQIAGYVIEGTLGEGGMGVVYRGRDTTLDRPVAIKVIQAKKMDDKGKDRFFREARACSKISHANIITVYAAGEEQGCPYLAMELIDGETLRDVIERGPARWHQATQWTIDLLDALGRVHDAGIVHRDLKPENIMITRDGVIKLMDFGLSHLQAASTLTEEGTTLGTVPYMSPEQVSGHKADARSDLFSVASVFHEMITGLHPFRGEHPMAIMYSIKNETPRALKLSSQELPAGMQSVLDKAFAKEIDKRYQTATEFRDELIELIPGGTTESTILSPGGASGKRKIGPVPVSLIAVLAIAAGIYTIFFSDHGDRARAVTYYTYGQRAERNDSLEAARDYYQRSIEADDTYAPVWEKLGFFAFAAGNLAAADSFYASAIKHDPGFLFPMYQRAEIARSNGDPEAAKFWYEKAIETQPDFWPAYNNYGDLLRQIGELESAKKILDAALNQNPPEDVSPALRKNRGLVAWDLNEPDSARIYLEGLENIYANDPEFQRVWTELNQ
jgi:tetratricopeptide (TPR) repeat protein/predicted Ser/Thr protein kinase